jgi:hypothetical protein
MLTSEPLRCVCVCVCVCLYARARLCMCESAYLHVDAYESSPGLHTYPTGAAMQVHLQPEDLQCDRSPPVDNSDSSQAAGVGSREGGGREGEQGKDGIHRKVSNDNGSGVELGGSMSSAVAARVGSNGGGRVVQMRLQELMAEVGGGG